MRRQLLLILLAISAVLGPATAAAACGPGATIDGMHVRHLPGGLGTSTDFEYEFDDVAFVSRVWESRTGDGGYRVDLTVDVLRGARLGDAAALHDWFIAYEDRPAGEAQYVPTTVRGRPGWICADEVFWLVRPGVAMSVHLDTTRWPQRELLRIARSARTVGGTTTPSRPQ